MTAETLILGAAFSAFAAVVYAGVGRVLAKRVVSPDARRAAWMFVVWWYALAATTAITAVLTTLAALGITDLAVHVTLTVANLGVICVAVAGLLHYLVYLLLGRDALVPIVAFYVVIFGVALYWIMWSTPTGVDVQRWVASLSYARRSSAADAALVLTLLGPHVVGAFAYGALFWKTKDRAARMRIASVAVSILVWFGSAVVASFTAYAETDAWQVTSRLIGLAAAVTILLAHAPPPWITRRLSGDRHTAG